MHELWLEDHGDGITAIDTYFHRPRLDASHLILEKDEAAFIDVGTNHAVPYLLDALKTLEIPKESVRYILLTHVHLDHAGAAGRMMQALPNATLVVHPRGGRHMIDPSKLIAGATAVYGEEEMQRSYGTLIPVPSERVQTVEDGDELELAGRPLRFLHTEGHARHHYCVHDERTQSIFTGDTFGLAYPELMTPMGPYLFPTTTPVQFDPEKLHESMDRLIALGPKQVFLTHFSKVDQPAKWAPQLHQSIDESVAIGLKADQSPDRHAELLSGLEKLALRQLEAMNCPLDKETIHEILAMDIELNAQGIEVWLDKKKKD